MAICPFLFAIWSFAPAQVAGASADGPREVITSIFQQLGVKDFRFRKTKHFTIGYDTSDEFIRPHVGRLEGIHGAVSRFCEASGFKSAAMGSPLVAKEEAGGRAAESAGLLPIIFFNRFETFARYAQELDMPSEGIAGFYHQANNVAAFVNASDLPSIRQRLEHIQNLQRQLSEAKAAEVKDREAIKILDLLIPHATKERDELVGMFNRFVLQHEAAHQILFNAGVHSRGADSPQWLVEGLACQFEVPQSDPSGSLRSVNHMRLADLREAMEVPLNAQGDFKVDAAALTAPGKLIPLRQLVSSDAAFESADRVKLAYAQSWALVLYLHRSSPDAFREYLRKLAKREAGTQSHAEAELAEFESSFGPISREFEQSWADFLVRLPFEP